MTADRRQKSRPTLALALLAVFAPSAAHGELAAIWAVDDGTKVKADAVDHTLKKSNGIFDGKAIKLFGARNETVAFQLILQGGAATTSDVSVALPQLGTIKNGATLSNDPDTYYLGRNIELFKQLYLEIKERSSGLAWEYDGAEVPKGLLGPVPDPLVPLNIIGNTMEVPKARNQGIWIDVYIPKGTQPGVHTGSLQVKIAGQSCAGCTLTVELTVLEATLPDVAPVKTMLYFSADEPDTALARYLANPHGDPRKIQERHYKLFRRHLVTGIIGADNAPNDFIKQRLDGTLFSAASGYSGWGEGKGQDVYSIDTYGQGKIPHDEAVVWNSWLATHAPQGADYFAYVWDEPSKSAFSKIEERAGIIDPLPTLVTTNYTSALGNVDIFATYAESFDTAEFNAGRAAGKKMWIYNGTRPFSGSFATDDTAVSMRVNPWIQYKRGIDRWFYWEATYYNDFQGGAGAFDVFAKAMTFTGAGNQVNGDGVLVYPGRDRVFPKRDLGFDHPLPSVRLKNWRRGIQDIAYLELVAAKDKGVHDAVLSAILPKELDQMTWDRKVSWPDSGEPWLEQRRKLAQILIGSGAGTTVPAPEPGETTPGETAPGETAPGETAPGEPKPGETAPGEPGVSSAPTPTPEGRAPSASPKAGSLLEGGCTVGAGADGGRDVLLTLLTLMLLVLGRRRRSGILSRLDPGQRRGNATSYRDHYRQEDNSDSRDFLQLTAVAGIPSEASGPTCLTGCQPGWRSEPIYRGPPKHD